MYSRITADHRLVPTYGRHEVTARPEVLPYEVALPLSVDSRDMNRALPLDVPHNLRHRFLRRYRDHPVYAFTHQMPFFDPAFSLRG
jgi:hypothetical protein